MLGVFLLPAFTRLGHERPDLLSPGNGIHVCTDLGLYSHQKEFLGNGFRNHVSSKGKIRSTGGSEEGRTPRRCVTQDSKPNRLLTELFQSPFLTNLCIVFQKPLEQS